MNKELQKWISKIWTLGEEEMEMVQDIIDHVKCNPHLLNEGEREEEEYVSIGEERVTLKTNPHPTDEPILAPDNKAISGQNWEKEADTLFSKHKKITINQYEDEFYVLGYHNAITALTEMAELAYERGRGETYKKWLLKTEVKHQRIIDLETETTELQQQLAEKDRIVSDYENRTDSVRILRLESELAAAKANLERMKLQAGELTEEQINSSKLTWYVVTNQLYETQEKADRVAKSINKHRAPAIYKTYKIIEL